MKMATCTSRIKVECLKYLGKRYNIELSKKWVEKAVALAHFIIR